MPPSEYVVQVARQILAEADIEGLIKAGAPRDEYDAEARDVAFQWQQHQEQLSEDAVYNWLRISWARSFDLDDNDLVKRDDALRAAAHRIYWANAER